MVAIPLNHIHEVGYNVGNEAVGKSHLNGRREKILSEMRDNPNITMEQLHQVLGISKTAVENNIAFLRKNGYVEHVGSRKNGYWKVLKQ